MSKRRVHLPVFLDSLLPLKCRSVDSSVRGRVVWFFVANKRMMFFSIANYAKNMPTLWGRQVVESRGPGWVVAGKCCPYAGIAAVRALASELPNARDRCDVETTRGICYQNCLND